jgi:hypothetical protein
MSAGVLFAVGALVTILVAIGVALPVYGAVLDGRYQSRHEESEVLELARRRPGRRPAA